MIERIQKLERMVKWLYCKVKNTTIGGIQSIVAGANITVDNSDPANPVVSSTGGGAEQNNIPNIITISLEDIGMTSSNTELEIQQALSAYVEGHNIQDTELYQIKLIGFPDSVTPNISNKTQFESLAIGGGHDNIFQDGEGTGQGHTAFGFEAGLSIGDCWATTLCGWKSGRALSNKNVVNSWTGVIGNTGNTLYGYNTASIADGMLDCSYFGTSAGQNSTTCMDNSGFGIWSLRLIEEGSENAGFGHLSLGYVIGKGSAANVDSLEIDPLEPTYSWGHRNVGLGDKAGALDNGGNPLNYVKKNVYVGAKTRGNNYTVNENVFGYSAGGMGSNTVSIGNTEVVMTHYYGVLASFCDRRVADLPAPSRLLLGAKTHVLDCTHRTFDLEVIGGGSNNVPVWCDGSVWRVG